MFTLKNLKLLVLALVLAMPLVACGQRVPFELSKDAIEDSTSY